MSARMPWFRMYTDFLNDPKMIGLAFEDQRHFIGVLALKSDGAIDDTDSEDLLNRIVAQRLWIDHGIIRDVKKRLKDAGLIDADWQPLAWNKRQFVSDRDSTAAERKRRERPAAHVWRAIRERIFSRDNYTCQYCGERGKKLECDHIHPVAKGGTHEDENLTTACFSCNRSKRDKLVSEWRPS